MESSFARKLTGIFAAAVVLLLSGCAAKVQPLEYGAPVPEDQAAILIIPDGYTVTGFNGTAVEWKYSLPGEMLKSEAAIIKLPAGNHQIRYRFYRAPSTVTSYEQHGNVRVKKTTTYPATTYTGDADINMEPGKKYIIKSRGVFTGHEIIIDASDKYKFP